MRKNSLLRSLDRALGAIPITAMIDKIEALIKSEMKSKITHQLKKSKGFGSLEVIQRLPKKRRRVCDTLELQLEVLRATMNKKSIEMQEEFALLLLTDEKELIAGVSLYRGTADEVAVDRADIIRLAVLARAYYVIVAHNHPTGHPQPSNADVDSASRLAHALRFCNLQLLDSIIITRKNHFSLHENGLMWV
jgi:DNA repair protein RadC